MNEIKFGKLHYKLDNQSGFWVSVIPTDPQSATVTLSELTYLVREFRDYMITLVERANKKQEELNAFLEYHS